MSDQPAEILVLEGQLSIDEVLEGGDHVVHEAAVQH
jgi:hypothetical protein